MTLRTEPIESTAHIDLLFRFHIKKRKVNGTATSMTTFLIYILMLKEHTLVEVRIEISLHKRIGDIGSPTHEVINALLRTVGIVYLQSITKFYDIVANSLETISRLFGKQCRWFLITINADAHEVIRTKIAYLHNCIGNDIGKSNELTGIVGCSCLCALLFCRALTAAHHCHRQYA